MTRDLFRGRAIVFVALALATWFFPGTQTTSDTPDNDWSGVKMVGEEATSTTQDALNDPLLKGLDWAPSGRMAYAGYPILVRSQAVGAVAVFFTAGTALLVPGVFRRPRPH